METASRIIDIADVKIWHKAARVTDIPENGGAAVKINDMQIAIYNFTSTGKWYASQNHCPHRIESVLARGIIGDSAGEPKIACPLHKNSFSLETGQCLSGANYEIDLYPVKIEDGYIYIGMR